MKHRRFAIHSILIVSVSAWSGIALAQSAAERSLPARALPTPTTVSSELQKVIAHPGPGSSSAKFTDELWRTIEKQADAGGAKSTEERAQSFGVSLPEKKLGGVRVYDVKPATI